MRSIKTDKTILLLRARFLPFVPLVVANFSRFKIEIDLLKNHFCKKLKVELNENCCKRFDVRRKSCY